MIKNRNWFPFRNRMNFFLLFTAILPSLAGAQEPERLGRYLCHRIIAGLRDWGLLSQKEVVPVSYEEQQKEIERSEKWLAKQRALQLQNLKANQSTRDFISRVHPIVNSLFQESLVLDYLKSGEHFQSSQDSLRFAEAKQQLFAAICAFGVDSIPSGFGRYPRLMNPNLPPLSPEDAVVLLTLRETKKIPSIDTPALVSFRVGLRFPIEPSFNPEDVASINQRFKTTLGANILRFAPNRFTCCKLGCSGCPWAFKETSEIRNTERRIEHLKSVADTVSSNSVDSKSETL